MGDIGQILLGGWIVFGVLFGAFRLIVWFADTPVGKHVGQMGNPNAEVEKPTKIVGTVRKPGHLMSSKVKLEVKR